MGLNFNWRVYVKKNQLEEAFKFVARNCCHTKGVAFREGKFYAISSYRAPQIIPDLCENKDLCCSFLFDKDDKILEHKIKREIDVLKPDKETKSSFSIKDAKLSIGNIDITIKDYSEKLPDTFEIRFEAVTSDMSRLFRDSPSIEKFFKRFCREVNAEYGYLDKEHEGDRLIWFEGEEFSLDLPDDYGNHQSLWSPFRMHGFIHGLRRFSNKKNT